MAPTTRGWIVTFAAFAMNLVLGAAFVLSASPGGGPRTAATTLTWSLFASALGLAAAMPFAGALQDHFGPGPMATLGAVLVGVALIAGMDVPAAQPFSTPLPIAAVGLGIIAGSGIALCYSASLVAAARWFAPHRRGLVCGIVVGGFAVAGTVGAALSAATTIQLSSTTAHVVVGVGAFILLAALAQLLSAPPSGLVPPYAYEAAPLATAPVNAPASYAWRSVVGTPAFATMWLTLAVGSGAALGGLWLALHVSAGQSGVLASPGLLIAATLGNVMSRPISGLASDWIGRRVTLIVAMTLLALTFCALAILGTSAALAAAFAAGVGYGSLLAVFPSLTFDFFGTEHGGADYGLVFTGWGLGGGLGVLVASAFLTGEWATTAAPIALFVVSAACALGAALVLATRRPRRATSS